MSLPPPDHQDPNAARGAKNIISRCLAVTPGERVHVLTYRAGTDLEVQLRARHPLISSSGRPTPGISENLPAGAVFTHPARVSGTLVVDRAIFGPGIDADRAALRSSPVRFTFEGGRLVSHETSDRALGETIDKYLESHAHASRVGLVFFPTNYLVRSEVGIDLQDRLLPGMNVALGCSASEKTHASFDAPVQMVLLGRRQSVDADGRKLFEAGRVAQTLVQGIDPFR